MLVLCVQLVSYTQHKEYILLMRTGGYNPAVLMSPRAAVAAEAQLRLRPRR